MTGSRATASTSDASRLIEALALQPHPEGGYYREIHRSPSVVHPADGRGERSALTVIHFLLPHHGRSRWHVVRSEEQWTWLAGAPLDLFVIDPLSMALRTTRLGPARSGASSAAPRDATAIVPADAWQAARAPEGWSLVTCTVAPGFEFEDFRMLDSDAAAAAQLRAAHPALAELL